MICPVCYNSFSNLRLHFSMTNCRLHEQYLEHDIQKVKKVVESIFNLNLAIGGICHKMRQQEYVCVCNTKFIKNTWIEKFGIDEFNKKIQLLEKYRVENQRRAVMYNSKMNSIRFDTDAVNIEKEIEIACYKNDSFKQVRLRDVVCQECGKKDEKLDVHHIIPRRLFERYDFEQHHPDNLILLCARCHSTIGQELDEIIINIFVLHIKMMCPVTYEYVLYQLRTQKKTIFKRKVGTPKLYNVTVNDVDKAKVDGKVMISKAIELMPNVPKQHIVKACKDNNMTYINPKCLTKNLKTKICPVCGWSGSFRFSKHVMKTVDEQHLSFLIVLEKLYIDDKLGCDKIADMYNQYNFTREIVEAVLKDAGIYYKILQKVVA